MPIIVRKDEIIANSDGSYIWVIDIQGNSVIIANYFRGKAKVTSTTLDKLTSRGGRPLAGGELEQMYDVITSEVGGATGVPYAESMMTHSIIGLKKMNAWVKIMGEYEERYIVATFYNNKTYMSTIKKKELKKIVQTGQGQVIHGDEYKTIDKRIKNAHSINVPFGYMRKPIGQQNFAALVLKEVIQKTTDVAGDIADRLYKDEAEEILYDTRTVKKVRGVTDEHPDMWTIIDYVMIGGVFMGISKLAYHSNLYAPGKVRKIVTDLYQKTIGESEHRTRSTWEHLRAEEKIRKERIKSVGLLTPRERLAGRYGKSAATQELLRWKKTGEVGVGNAFKIIFDNNKIAANKNPVVDLGSLFATIDRSLIEGYIDLDESTGKFFPDATNALNISRNKFRQPISSEQKIKKLAKFAALRGPVEYDILGISSIGEILDEKKRFKQIKKLESTMLKYMGKDLSWEEKTRALNYAVTQGQTTAQYEQLFRTRMYTKGVKDYDMLMEIFGIGQGESPMTEVSADIAQYNVAYKEKALSYTGSGMTDEKILAELKRSLREFRVQSTKIRRNNDLTRLYGFNALIKSTPINIDLGWPDRNQSYSENIIRRAIANLENKTNLDDPTLKSIRNLYSRNVGIVMDIETIAAAKQTIPYSVSFSLIAGEGTDLATAKWQQIGIENLRVREKLKGLGFEINQANLREGGNKTIFTLYNKITNTASLENALTFLRNTAISTDDFDLFTKLVGSYGPEAKSALFELESLLAGTGGDRQQLVRIKNYFKENPNQIIMDRLKARWGQNQTGRVYAKNTEDVIRRLNEAVEIMKKELGGSYFLSGWGLAASDLEIMKSVAKVESHNTSHFLNLPVVDLLVAARKRGINRVYKFEEEIGYDLTRKYREAFGDVAHGFSAVGAMAEWSIAPDGTMKGFMPSTHVPERYWDLSKLIAKKSLSTNMPTGDFGATKVYPGDFVSVEKIYNQGKLWVARGKKSRLAASGEALYMGENFMIYANTEEMLKKAIADNFFDYRGLEGNAILGVNALKSGPFVVNSINRRRKDRYRRRLASILGRTDDIGPDELFAWAADERNVSARVKKDMKMILKYSVESLSDRSNQELKQEIEGIKLKIINTKELVRNKLGGKTWLNDVHRDLAVKTITMSLLSEEFEGIEQLVLNPRFFGGYVTAGEAVNIITNETEKRMFGLQSWEHKREKIAKLVGRVPMFMYPGENVANIRIDGKTYAINVETPYFSINRILDDMSKKRIGFSKLFNREAALNLVKEAFIKNGWIDAADELHLDKLLSQSDNTENTVMKYLSSVISEKVKEGGNLENILERHESYKTTTGYVFKNRRGSFENEIKELVKKYTDYSTENKNVLVFANENTKRIEKIFKPLHDIYKVSKFAKWIAEAKSGENLLKNMIVELESDGFIVHASPLIEKATGNAEAIPAAVRILISQKKELTKEQIDAIMRGKTGEEFGVLVTDFGIDRFGTVARDNVNRVNVTFDSKVFDVAIGEYLKGEGEGAIKDAKSLFNKMESWIPKSQQWTQYHVQAFEVMRLMKQYGPKIKSGEYNISQLKKILKAGSLKLNDYIFSAEELKFGRGLKTTALAGSTLEDILNNQQIIVDLKDFDKVPLRKAVDNLKKVLEEMYPGMEKSTIQELLRLAETHPEDIKAGVFSALQKAKIFGDLDLTSQQMRQSRWGTRYAIKQTSDAGMLKFFPGVVAAGIKNVEGGYANYISLVEAVEKSKLDISPGQVGIRTIFIDEENFKNEKFQKEMKKAIQKTQDFLRGQVDNQSLLDTEIRVKEGLWEEIKRLNTLRDAENKFFKGKIGPGGEIINERINQLNEVLVRLERIKNDTSLDTNWKKIDAMLRISDDVAIADAGAKIRMALNRNISGFAAMEWFLRPEAEGVLKTIDDSLALGNTKMLKNMQLFQEESINITINNSLANILDAELMRTAGVEKAGGTFFAKINRGDTIVQTLAEVQRKNSEEFYKIEQISKGITRLQGDNMAISIEGRTSKSNAVIKIRGFSDIIDPATGAAMTALKAYMAAGKPQFNYTPNELFVALGEILGLKAKGGKDFLEYGAFVVGKTSNATMGAIDELYDNLVRVYDEETANGIMKKLGFSKEQVTATHMMGKIHENIRKASTIYKEGTEVAQQGFLKAGLAINLARLFELSEGQEMNKAALKEVDRISAKLMEVSAGVKDTANWAREFKTIGSNISSQNFTPLNKSIALIANQFLGLGVEDLRIIRESTKNNLDALNVTTGMGRTGLWARNYFAQAQKFGYQQVRSLPLLAEILGSAGETSAGELENMFVNRFSNNWAFDVNQVERLRALDILTTGRIIHAYSENESLAATKAADYIKDFQKNRVTNLGQGMLIALENKIEIDKEYNFVYGNTNAGIEKLKLVDQIYVPGIPATPNSFIYPTNTIKLAKQLVFLSEFDKVVKAKGWKLADINKLEQKEIFRAMGIEGDEHDNAQSVVKGIIKDIQNSSTEKGKTITDIIRGSTLATYQSYVNDLMETTYKGGWARGFYAQEQAGSISGAIKYMDPGSFHALSEQTKQIESLVVTISKNKFEDMVRQSLVDLQEHFKTGEVIKDFTETNFGRTLTDIIQDRDGAGKAFVNQLLAGDINRSHEGLIAGFLSRHPVINTYNTLGVAIKVIDTPNYNDAIEMSKTLVNKILFGDADFDYGMMYLGDVFSELKKTNAEALKDANAHQLLIQSVRGNNTKMFGEGFKNYIALNKRITEMQELFTPEIAGSNLEEAKGMGTLVKEIGKAFSAPGDLDTSELKKIWGTMGEAQPKWENVLQTGLAHAAMDPYRAALYNLPQDKYRKLFNHRSHLDSLELSEAMLASIEQKLISSKKLSTENLGVYIESLRNGDVEEIKKAINDLEIYKLFNSEILARKTKATNEGIEGNKKILNNIVDTVFGSSEIKEIVADLKKSPLHVITSTSSKGEITRYLQNLAKFWSKTDIFTRHMPDIATHLEVVEGLKHPQDEVNNVIDDNLEYTRQLLEKSRVTGTEHMNKVLDVYSRGRINPFSVSKFVIGEENVSSLFARANQAMPSWMKSVSLAAAGIYGIKKTLLDHSFPVNRNFIENNGTMSADGTPIPHTKKMVLPTVYSPVPMQPVVTVDVRNDNPDSNDTAAWARAINDATAAELPGRKITRTMNIYQRGTPEDRYSVARMMNELMV